MITSKERVLRLQRLSQARCWDNLYISHRLHCCKLVDLGYWVDNGCQIEYKNGQGIPCYGEKVKVHRYFVTDNTILLIGFSDTRYHNRMQFIVVCNRSTDDRTDDYTYCRQKQYLSKKHPKDIV